MKDEKVKTDLQIINEAMAIAKDGLKDVCITIASLVFMREQAEKHGEPIAEVNGDKVKLNCHALKRLIAFIVSDLKFDRPHSLIEFINDDFILSEAGTLILNASVELLHEEQQEFKSKSSEQQKASDIK